MVLNIREKSILIIISIIRAFYDGFYCYSSMSRLSSPFSWSANISGIRSGTGHLRKQNRSKIVVQGTVPDLPGGGTRSRVKLDTQHFVPAAPGRPSHQPVPSQFPAVFWPPPGRSTWIATEVWSERPDRLSAGAALRRPAFALSK